MALAAALLGSGAHAQSAGLLESVRLHRPGAAAQARAELEACRVKKCAEQGRLALLAGTLTLSDGQAADALALLRSTPPPAPLAPVHAFYLGQAAFYAGNPAQAADAFARAVQGASPALLPRARARWGEALLAAGQPAAAAPVLEEAARAQPSPELLFQRAAARQAVGDIKGAQDDLRRVAVESPAHPYADAALTQLAALTPPVVLTPDERLRRARGLLDAGAPARALDELTLMERARDGRKPALLAQASLTRALAHYALGQEPQAEAALAQARKGPREFAAEAALVQARRALKNPDNSVPRTLMAAVARSYPHEAAADEASFFVGWLELQAGHLTEAVAAFATFEQRFPRSRRRDEGLWFRALAHLQLEQYAEARGALSRLVALMPRSSLVPQAQYWIARADALGGAPTEAVAPAYEALIRAAPGSYYALLAAERLREQSRQPPPAFPERPRVLAGQRPAQLALAVALSEAGLYRDAADEVRAQAARLRSGEEALPFVHALLQLGEYGQAHAIAARLLWGQAYTARAPEALAAFYPRAFAGAVEQEAEHAKVDPYLVWAIMRRESAFRPEAASAADARGLMQVIPRTGAAIAEQLKEGFSAPDELFSPERNIRYGAWYLGALMKRFGHPALAAAAYNAGPSATLRWTRERGALPIDLFVEAIPYRETRGYVKQVVGDLYLYHSLYGDPKRSPHLGLTLPQPLAEGVNF
ncbi:transglycosylase SLT domain-containing protein [Aggregicoccus sp. 17bor-14]|uniref:transglycosylase SLT domain-containing protein n=1 Tax=Myxococcaceae TaxID=31 RepID=UPI00351A3758